MTFETFDQKDDETWPDQKKDNDKDKDKDNDKDKYNKRTLSESDPRDLWPFETFDQRDEETWPDQKKDNDNDRHGGDMAWWTKMR